MKNIFLFIILALLPFYTFTEPQSSVVLIKTTVQPITLSDASLSLEGGLGLYKLYGSLNTEGSINSDFLLAKDISTNTVVVYFRVAQMAKTKTEETIQLEVSAEKLVNSSSVEIKNKDPLAVVETQDPNIDDISCFKGSGLKVTYELKSPNEIDLSLKYLGYAPIENIDVVSFKSTWNKMPGLAVGEYTSEITLSYIIN